MPRYDFECPDHGEFEAAVKFADSDKPQPCPYHKGSGDPGATHSEGCAKWHGCKKMCKRVARLYPANISYCDGMTQHPAVKDSENTKKYGHTI